MFDQRHSRHLGLAIIVLAGAFQIAVVTGSADARGGIRGGARPNISGHAFHPGGGVPHFSGGSARPQFHPAPHPRPSVKPAPRPKPNVKPGPRPKPNVKPGPRPKPLPGPKPKPGPKPGPKPPPHPPVPPHPRPPPPPPPHPDHIVHPWADGAAFATGIAVGAAAAYAAGTVVYDLPGACVAQTVNGLSYWLCDGVWYRPSFAGADVTYVVVTPP